MYVCMYVCMYIVNRIYLCMYNRYICKPAYDRIFISTNTLIIGGFTALAHPSSIEVGLGHGVFVLDQSNSTDEHLMAEVSRVLQKPTEKQMLSENCIYSGSSTEEEEGGEMEVDATDFVYTDSCYFFDAEISKKLLKFNSLSLILSLILSHSLSLSLSLSLSARL